MPHSTTYNKTSSKKSQSVNKQTQYTYQKEPSRNLINKYKDKLKEWKKNELELGSRDADINQISKKLVDSFKSNDENKEIDLTGLKFIDLPTKNILKIKNLKIIRINGSDESHQLQELKYAGITIEYIHEVADQQQDIPSTHEHNTSSDFSEIENSEEINFNNEIRLEQLSFQETPQTNDKTIETIQNILDKLENILELFEKQKIENAIKDPQKEEEVVNMQGQDDEAIKDPQQDNGDRRKKEVIDQNQESEQSQTTSFISKLIDISKADDEEFLSADEINLLDKNTIDLEKYDETRLIIELMKIFTKDFIETLSNYEEKKVLSKDVIKIISSIIDKQEDQDFLLKAEKIISDKIHSFSDDKMVEIIFKLKDLCNTKKPEDFSRLDSIGIVSYIRKKIIFQGIVELAEKIGKETQKQSSENISTDDKCTQTYIEQDHHDKIMANTLSYAGVIIGNSLDLDGNILNLNMASIYPKQDESLLFLDKIKSKLEKFSDEIKRESLPNFLIEIIAKDAYKDNRKDMKFSEIISQDFVKKLKDKVEEVALGIFSGIKIEELNPKKAEVVKQKILDCKITELSKLLKLQLKQMEKLATLDVNKKIIETLTTNLQKTFDDIKSEIIPSSKIHHQKSQSLLTKLKKCLGKT